MVSMGYKSVLVSIAAYIAVLFQLGASAFVFVMLYDTSVIMSLLLTYIVWDWSCSKVVLLDERITKYKIELGKNHEKSKR